MLAGDAAAGGAAEAAGADGDGLRVTIGAAAPMVAPAGAGTTTGAPSTAVPSTAAPSTLASPGVGTLRHMDPYLPTGQGLG